jgi:hypothetical protein
LLASLAVSYSIVTKLLADAPTSASSWCGFKRKGCGHIIVLPHVI